MTVEQLAARKKARKIKGAAIFGGAVDDIEDNLFAMWDPVELHDEQGDEDCLPHLPEAA